MLPFEPESTEELKARYDEALQEVFDPREVANDPDLSPGKKREHVFDFEDGVRLIVSVDQIDKKVKPRITHYSASVVDYICDPEQFEDQNKYVIFILCHINDIRPKPMTGRIMTRMINGVLHVFYDESQQPCKINVDQRFIPEDPRMN